MFIRLFRTNYSIQILFLIFISFLLWIDVFNNINNHEGFSILSPLYMFCFSWCEYYSWPVILTSIILLITQAILLNKILENIGFSSRNSYFTAFIYILLYSYYPGILYLNTIIPANFFLILAFRYITKVLQNEEIRNEIFTASLLLSIASLFDIYHIAFIPLIWITLILYRSLFFKEWIISIIGIIIPYIYLFFVLFWNDNLVFTIEHYLNFFYSLSFLTTSWDITMFHAILIIYIAAIAFLSFTDILRSLLRKIINIRKLSVIIIWMLILGAAFIPFMDKLPLNNGAAVLLPISIITSSWLTNMKSKVIAELILLILIILIIMGKFLI